MRSAHKFSLAATQAFLPAVAAALLLSAVAAPATSTAAEAPAKLTISARPAGPSRACVRARALVPLAPEVIDRIVARIEDDILLQSEVRELRVFQELVQGQASSEDRLLNQLIAQWIVINEAAAAHFSQPSVEEVRQEVERLRKQFTSAEAYRQRLRQLGLSEAAAQRLIARQLYVSRYLDYKFRPAAQVEQQAVRKYYQEELGPQLAARGQAPPPLRDVYEQIRELLIQRDISARAGRWLDETRPRLKIEMVPPGGGS